MKMTNYSFVLSKEALDIGLAECEALLDTSLEQIAPGLLVGKMKNTSLLPKLAYTKAVYKNILEETPQRVKSCLEDSSYPISGSIKIEKIDFGPKSLSSTQARALLIPYLGSPTINLTAPKHTITFISTPNKWIVGEKVFENTQDFEKRKNQYRPAPHPTSLHPKLARAMINLAGNQKTILDPFCGSGGILIEATLMNLKTTGSDIEQAMINRAKINLDYYNLKAILKVEDARVVKGTYDAIITDLPYGRNSKAHDLHELYSEFLMHAKTLTKKMVIAFPSLVDANTLIKDNGWKIIFSHKQRLHKSLDKLLYVLEL